MKRMHRAGAMVLLVLLVAAAGWWYTRYRQVDVYGGTLVYETYGSWGQTSPYPTVLLAGGPGNRPEYLQPVADILAARDLGGVLPTGRGIGASVLDRLDSTTIQLRWQVNDVERLREHLGARKLILIGHSWGGIQAMAYAARYPDQVAGLILLGSGGTNLQFFEGYEQRLRARLSPQVQFVLDSLATSQAALLNPDSVRLAMLSIRRPAYFLTAQQAASYGASLPPDWHNPRVAQLQFANLIRINYDISQALKAYKGPVVIVQGTGDAVGNEAVQQIQAALPQAQFLPVLQAGHFPWIEQPADFEKQFRVALDMVVTAR